MSLTEKQMEYLSQCNHRWNVKTGATGSGKSYVDMAVTIPKRICAAKGEGLFVMMGNTRGTLERNILEPMRGIWGNDCVGTIRSDNTVMLFGKKVYALGADNRKHVARIQGATFEYVYGDEVTTWSRDVFEMLKSRLRCEHSHFDGTCNPDSPGHWFKEFLDGNADVYCQKYVIDDGVLPPHVVEELKKEYAGTVYYDRFILGEWASASGVIYPMYADCILEPPEDVPEQYVVSMDYGTQNAFAALLWAKYGDIWHAVSEYYYSGRATGIQKTDEEYADDLDKWLKDVPKGQRIKTIIDPSAASFIALLKKRKDEKGMPRYRVVPADNAVSDGIRETATCMHRGKIKFAPWLDNWKKEVQGYAWDDSETEDRPIKENDHCLVGETLVNTKDGAKPISELVGTSGEVWSYNTETCVAELKPYHDCRLTQEQAEIYEIETEDGRFIRCTGEHPILTGRGYVLAKDLLVSDRIIDIVVGVAETSSVGIKAIRKIGKADVYNMEVEDNHNFAIEGGLVVHNCMDAMRYFVKTMRLSVIKSAYTPMYM